MLAPPSVVTDRERSPVAAVVAILIETGRLLGVPPLRTVAVIPAPEKDTAETPTRFWPRISRQQVSKLCSELELTIAEDEVRTKVNDILRKLIPFEIGREFKLIGDDEKNFRLLSKICG